jgi:cytochrome c biogenesis protein CcmG, thiol:disulfide interchange protein DsbE
VVTAAVALCSTLAAAGCGTAPARTIVIEGPARPLPPRPLTTVGLDGFTEIVSGLRGRPVVVNVWASWCPPCRAEARLLERTAAAYEGRVQFLGVATRDTEPDAEAFIDRYDVSYPNLYDRDGSIRRFLGLRGLPSTYVFDGEGRLVGEVVGGVTEQSLAARLDDATRR